MLKIDPESRRFLRPPWELIGLGRLIICPQFGVRNPPRSGFSNRAPGTTFLRARTKGGGLSKIAWAFLRPIGAGGEINVDIRNGDPSPPSHSSNGSNRLEF